MKKFIKKTIAGLIAGVMAISSMPFAALTAQAADYQIPANLSAETANTAPKTFDATIYFGGQVIPDYQGNVVYCSKEVNVHDVDKDYLGEKMCAPRNVVMVYNGVSDATYMPVYAGFYATGGSNVNAYYVRLNWGSNPFSIDNWKGYKNVSLTNSTGLLKSNVDFSSTDKDETILNYKSFNDSENCLPFTTQNHNNGDYYWWTKMHYTGKGNTTNYFEKYTNPTFEYGHRNKIGFSWYNRTYDRTPSANVYVVNYQPVYDILANVSTVSSLGVNNYTFKNLFNTVWGHEEEYTVSSLNAYYTAVSKLVSIDPQATFNGVSDSDVETKTSALAKEIKEACSEYATAAANLEIRKYTYTFIKIDGSETTVEAQNDVKALEANKTPNTENTQKTYAGENQHKWTEYTWPEKATNYTFKEQATEKFEACNVVNGQCTECGNVTLDTSAYDAALKEAEAKVLNPDNRYTTDSIDALRAEIASVKADRENVKTQDQLNALVTRLQTASNSVVQSKFNVVFVTVGLDSTSETEKFNDYIEYGETYNADAGANVKKWVVTTDNGNTSTVIDNFDQKASFVITKDAKIYAYLSGEDSSTTSSKVTFLGRHNQVVAIRYVADGKTLETKEVDAPSIPFYKFENWDVASVKGDGNEYTVKASYTCKQTSDEFCTVHFGDWSQAYAYDSYVYLPNTVAGTKYALYSDKECTKLLTVLDGVDFYAPKTSHIYVKAYDGIEEAKIAVTGSFAEKDVEAGKNYANFNCKFYLPAGEAIEWGVEVLSPDGTRTAKVKGEKLSERNEYTVRFATEIGSKVTSIKGRAYLVYVQDGVKKTIYSSDEYVEVIFNA